MKIAELIIGIKIKKHINQNEHSDILSIVFDSRKAESGSLFVATKGSQVDGHHYIEKAISQGSTTILCEHIPESLDEKVSYIQVENSQYALGILAKNLYGNPSSKMKVVGVTGTNGKTSTTNMCYQLFTLLGYKVGLLSTIEIRIGAEIHHATHTTPDALSIQENMARMVDSGCSHCFMEVSSHAIDQSRIAGIEFDGGVFTNITHDHLDYHLNFANYLSAKKKFFDNLPINSFALSNIDDKNGKIMMQNTAARKRTFAMNSMADYTVKILENAISYMQLKILTDEFILQLAGEFNAYNALATYGIAIELGERKEEVLKELSNIRPVEGRIDIITSSIKKIIGIIDYAHTPDAVEKVLSEIRKTKKDGEIITIIGCGGNRDKAKRPIMAQLACKLSDRAILTSDNPRDEDPLSILDDMKKGLDKELSKKALTVIDRREAIRTACMLADTNTIIALLGKGHEKYQEIKGEKHLFDDKEELRIQMEEQGL